MSKIHLVLKQSKQIQETVTADLIDKLYQMLKEDLDAGVEARADSGVNDIVGNIRATAVYEDSVTYLRAHFPNLTIDAEAVYVKFETEYVKELCATKFGDGNGCTTLQLAAVAPGYYFRNDKNIVKFNEFRYFTGFTQSDNGGKSFQNCSGLEEITLPPTMTYTRNLFAGCSSLKTVHGAEKLTGLTEIAESTFQSCSALESFTIPENVTKLEKWCFGWCTKLSTIQCLATTPPTLEDTPFQSASRFNLFVPAESVAAYQASDWNSVALSISAIE